MELHGGQITAKQLAACGVDTIFGVVAGPMIEVFAGAQEAGLRVIGCRHEENAAFMASAWGYVKRKPGVIVAGSGPAVTNCVTPMHVATESSMPLVVLGGSTNRGHRGWGGFQEADQLAFARPGCKWVQQIEAPRRIAEHLHLALGRAVSGRPGAVYVDYPAEIVARRIPEEEAGIRSSAPQVHVPYPDPHAIEQIADMLAEAERPLILIGKGAAWADAGPELERLVGRGLPYVTSPMARGVIPDDSAFFVNGARSAALKGADAILMIGAQWNWIFGFGRAPRYAADVRVAQIDVDAGSLYNASPLEVGVVADAKPATLALVEALEGRTLRTDKSRWLDTLREAALENEAGLQSVNTSDAVPIHPYRLVHELRQVLPRDASLSVDGETIMGIARVLLPSHRSRARLNAGTTGCMGTGVPYAIGAKLARPDCASVALVGDYAFGAAAMAIETAARNDVPVVFVVSNNEGIAGHMIQDAFMPEGSHRIASLLPADYEKLAEMVDGHAERVDQPTDLRPALERALASDRVSVVHVRTDPKARRLSGGNYLQ